MTPAIGQTHFVAERHLLAASEQRTWIDRLLHPGGSSTADDKEQHADSASVGGVQPYLWD